MGSSPQLHAIIVTGGDVPHRDVVSHFEDPHIVIAADSGWDSARALCLTPHVLIGDLDSISADGLTEARTLGTRIIEHHPDKDATDTELAIEVAVHHGATRITVLGGGDRFDHVVGALHLLTKPELAHLRVDAFFGSARITRVSAHDATEINVTTGSTISVHAIGGIARGVTTTGMKWSLANEDIASHVSRGVSNIAINEVVSASVTDGMLILVEPHFFDMGAVS